MALYLYGTDNMSTADIEEEYMGGRYPEMMVKWINDSSCVLTFPTKESAAECFHAFSVEDQQDISKEQIETNELALDHRNFDPAQGWRQALGFAHNTKGWQCLWMRYATDQDKKPEGHSGKNSRFYRQQMSNQRRGGKQEYNRRRFGERDSRGNRLPKHI